MGGEGEEENEKTGKINKFIRTILKFIWEVKHGKEEEIDERGRER
jgi:hypothetical protein